MTPKPLTRFGAIPSPAALLILACAYLNLTGWVLSLLGQLNRGGYVVSMILGAALWVFLRKRFGQSPAPQVNFQKLRRRFRRGFPLAFLLLAALIWVSGLLHAPNNYDALAYRVPRALHWLAEGRWHWVITDFNRLNTRTCGFEWASMPLLVLFNTDRWLFVVNAATYLLLPGLCFGVMTRLGVSPRVAWRWMWLLPSGYCYALQAGGIGNDMFGVLFALAAVDFALRARDSDNVRAAWLALLAAALLTSAKASNLPLLLPCALALLPSWRVLLARPLATGAVCALAAAVSFLPTAALNVKHCGDWTGLKAEPAGLLGGAPLFHVAVNSVLIVEQNFAPTVFPVAAQWNKLMERAIPAGLAVKLQHHFEPAGARFQLGEMIIEEGAGLGFGLSVLLLLTWLWRIRQGFSRAPCSVSAGLLKLELLVPLGAWIGVLVFMAQSGLTPAARYLTPFYVLLVTPLLAGRTYLKLVRRRWWQALGYGVFALAVLLLVVTQARPLWPAVTVLRAFDAEHSSHRLLRRAWTVYSVYGKRADAFAPARAALPGEANPLGLVSFDDPETSLWRPFGSQRILHVTQNETGDDLRRRGLKYVLASSFVLTQNWKQSPDDWLAQVNGEIVRRLDLELRAGRGPSEWYLVRLR